MADQPDARELLNEVIEGAQAMAKLATDEEVFRAAIDAFRAQDGESMNRLLVQQELAERCELVCHWLRSKEAVLLCLWLAGPPPLEQEPPDVREFAEVVAKLTADEELVELMANAVQERDRDAWAELITGQKLERFSHLLCHWVSVVHYRLVCDVVCRPIQVERPHLIPELQAAGQTIGRLAENEQLFGEVAKAVVANRCEVVGETLSAAGFASFCYVICEWFCSWRCLLVCLRLCRIFPIEPPKSDIEEMLEFARATGRLVEQGALERLAAAHLREDTETVEKLVKELDFSRFCVQFCHWVCFLRCRLFCFCVCPPRSIAVFTKIGGLYYSSDVNSHAPGNGLTVADSRAFYNGLRLNGGLSLVNGAPLIEYRFETVQTSADGTTLADGTPILPSSWVPVTPAQIEETNIGSFIRPIGVPPFVEIIQVWVKKTGPGIFTINPAADGWIQVPPMIPVPPMVPGSGWTFVPGADLIVFDTTTLAPTVVAIDEIGVDAGESANAPLGTDAHYGVRMRIRDQGSSGSGSEAGTCSHIAINNSRYNNISHHPYWPGGLFGASNELAVDSIGIAELASAPCSELTSSFTVEFTAAHSHLGPVGITLQGPGGPYAFDLSPNAPEDAGENWYGTATPSGWTFASLPPCAYLLDMSVTVLLTTGDTEPLPLYDYIAFCKGTSSN